MLMFNFKKDAAIKNIYQNIIDRSRCKSFYIDYDIEDKFESRFDLIVLHSFMIFQYFLDSGMKKNKLSQSIFDLMFQDIENNLREMGFGDIAVNKKMKLFIAAFYGRVASYSKSIQNYRLNSSINDLSITIKNNIYKNNNISDAKLNSLSRYVISNISDFVKNGYETNIKYFFQFNDDLEIT